MCESLLDVTPDWNAGWSHVLAGTGLEDAESSPIKDCESLATTVITVSCHSFCKAGFFVIMSVVSQFFFCGREVKITAPRHCPDVGALNSEGSFEHAALFAF